MKWVFKTEYQPPPVRPVKAVSLKKICCFFCCPAPFPAILPCSDCSSKWGRNFLPRCLAFLIFVRSREQSEKFQFSRPTGICRCCREWKKKFSTPPIAKILLPGLLRQKKFWKISCQRVAGGLWNVSLAEREKAAASGQQSPVPASYWRKEKRPPTAGRKSCPVRSMYGKTRKGQVCGSYRARFYRSTKIRFSLILPLRESCWGVPSPNPAYAACAA